MKNALHIAWRFCKFDWPRNICIDGKVWTWLVWSTVWAVGAGLSLFLVSAVLVYGIMLIGMLVEKTGISAGTAWLIAAALCIPVLALFAFRDISKRYAADETNRYDW